MTTILEQLQSYLSQPSLDWGRTIPSVVCKDGFKMSVQASENHYCTPRSNTGPWIAVEIGYPSMIEPLLWDYADVPGEWTDTVYPHVPIELAAAVIEVHGGFAGLRCKSGDE